MDATPERLEIALAKIRVVEAENDALRERVRVLEEELRGRGKNEETPPLSLGLTGQEGRLLMHLLARDLCSKEQLFMALYGDRPEADEPEIKIIDVLVCKLRKKLQSENIAITTIWGHGYMIDGKNKAALRALIKGERAHEVKVISH